MTEFLSALNPQEVRDRSGQLVSFIIPAESLEQLLKEHQELLSQNQTLLAGVEKWVDPDSNDAEWLKLAKERLAAGKPGIPAERVHNFLQQLDTLGATKRPSQDDVLKLISQAKGG